MIALIIFLILSLAANVALGFYLFRASKRLLEFDELFSLFVHDIETNVKYFGKLLQKPLFSATPEIVEANRNMSIIATRLNEYANRFTEATGSERQVETQEGQVR